MKNTKQNKKENKMTQLTITINIGAGKVAYFKVEFKKENFNRIVNELGNCNTIEDVKNNPLWRVV